MAYSAVVRQSCHRCLSPCHLTQSCALSTTPTYPHCEDTLQKPSSLLAVRRSSSTRPSVRHPQQSYYESHILCKHNLFRYAKDGMEQNFRTSIQQSNGTKDRSTYLDITSIMRIIGALHLDLPKIFTWRRSEKASSDQLSTKEASDDLYLDSPSHRHNNSIKQGHSVGTTTGKSLSDVSLDLKKAKMNISVKDVADVKCEKLSFSESVVKENISVKNYYSNRRDDVDHNNFTAFSLKEIDTKAIASKETVKGATYHQSENDTETTTNIIRQITNLLPKFSSQKQSNVHQKQTEKKTIRKSAQTSNMPRSVVDRRTRGLVKGLTVAKSTASKYVRLEELCHHLIAHPEAKTLAVKENVIPCLLHLRSSKDKPLQEQAMEGLALVGYIDPIKGRGIRILSLDGGGTRGLVAVEILRRLEEYCNKKIYQLFDYVCGVSTGSLIGIMLAEYKLSLDEVERLYKTFSSDMFNRYKLMGMGKLVMSQGYYDAQLWEKILQENIGMKTFLESTRDPTTPKISAISTLMNMTKLSNYVFRNYTLPSGAQTFYPGSCKYAFWQAVRASSAAPGYYQEYKIDEWIHQDGGLLTNNPTGIAIHEAKLLWPNDSIQCVVSLGTGRYEPSSEPETMNSGLRNKVNKIIQSATDTEAVHTVLNDLLPPSTYYRFNPYMSEDYFLDEIRPDRWNQMQLDTQMYCRKNQHKLQKASDQLLLTKLPHQRVADWFREKKHLLH